MFLVLLRRIKTTRRMYRFSWLILLNLLMTLPLRSYPAPADSTWVDSVYRSLSQEQRIAQLLIIRAYSGRDSVYNDSLVQIVRRYNIGGVCFFKGSPTGQAILTNRLQRSAETPLLITIDGEWGLGMRLDSAFSFPRQMALGAMTSDSLIYEMGRMVAKNCLRMGIQVNFAPVADVNNNPRNPVISFRSFGENPELVAAKSTLYMQGLQDGGVMAVAKHFPGHGDTDLDSHLTLPVINHSRQRLDSVELVPFRRLIREGVRGIMVGHLYVPCFDTTRNMPATLSGNVVTGLLRDQLGFKGAIFTDALDMQGVVKYFKPGEIEVKALLAGNDILLLPKHAEAAIFGIKTAVDSGWISPGLLEAKCRRVLELKYKYGLSALEEIHAENLVKDLNPPEAETMRQEMVNASMTLLKNDLRTVPLSGLEHRKIAVLSIGDSLPNRFQKTLLRYMPMALYNLPKKFTKAMADSIIREVSAVDIVIISLHGITSIVADSFGLSRPVIRLADTLVKANRTILTLFGTPYSMEHLRNLKKSEAILVAYQDNDATEPAAAQVLFGGLCARGKLPVTADRFPVGSGEETERSRLAFVTPEEIGLPGASLRIVDSLALGGIDAKAYPGCMILLAKNGKVFYEKAFGHPRYEDSARVTPASLYDLASVTKVAATTLALMKLYDDGRVSLDDSLGKYLAILKGSNKAGLHIRDVMAHQAGLQDWIPFYKATLVNGQPGQAFYRTEPSPGFPVHVAANLYLHKNYPDTLFSRIARSPLRTTHEYKYSDLGFYLLRLIVEKISGQPFERYLDSAFYKPLGVSTLGFTPLKRFSPAQIMPTEYDSAFRKQLVWGDVHDPGAAMLGGISGHAGLFSDACDLAVILQMLLREGTYGGKEYLKPSTIREFTRVQFPGKGNRRGAGFDKPLLNFTPDGPVCKGASPSSFGHSGFTGTYIWADPADGLVYIFLSNRVYPTATNQKLAEMNIRTNIHQAVYDLLHKYQIK